MKRPIIKTTNTSTILKMVRFHLDLHPADCLDYEIMAKSSIILTRKKFSASQLFYPAWKNSCQKTDRAWHKWQREGFERSFPLL